MRALLKIYQLTPVVDLATEPHATSTEYLDLGYETDWRKFMKLESMDRPGLTECGDPGQCLLYIVYCTYYFYLLLTLTGPI